MTFSATLSAVLFLVLAANSFADGTPAAQIPAAQPPVKATPAAATAPTSSNTAVTDAPATDKTFAVEQATHQFYASLNALLAGDATGMDTPASGHTPTK